MKSILLLLGSIMLGTTSFAQKIANDKVPSEVMAGFKAKFTSVTKSAWEMESANEYEAEFDIKGKKHSAKFDKSGNWLETETEIKIAELPKSVSQTIAKEFAGYKVEEAEKVETSDSGTVYEVKVIKAKQTYDVTVAASGKMIKKTTENDDNEKD